VKNTLKNTLYNLVKNSKILVNIYFNGIYDIFESIRLYNEGYIDIANKTLEIMGIKW